MSQNSEKGLSVVIPALNEQEAIAGVVDSVVQTLQEGTEPFEVIVVDDGSTDDTGRLVPSLPNVHTLKHEKRMGYGKSLADGIHQARYDSIAILDADGTYPVSSLPALRSAMGQHDMVIGWRKKILLPTAVLPKSFARRFLHLLAWILTGHRIVDLNSGMRIFKKDLWKNHKTYFPSGFSFTTTLTLLTLLTGRSLIYIPIGYYPRKGLTKVKYFVDGMKVAQWMIRLTWKLKPSRVLFPLVLLLALVLRLMGITYGLPGTFHPDEPHHINLAVYFGSGDLNPHVFKYPTLWMYVLSALYGVAFVFWSGFGFLHSVTDFSHLYIWNPTLFYLLARGLAASLGAASLFFVFLAGKKLMDESIGFFAALALAVSPPLVYFSHLAKPDMLMIFFASAALYTASGYFKDGRRKEALWTGVLLGFALSTQYTAILLVPLLFWAHLLRTLSQKKPLRDIFFSKDMLWGHLLLIAAFFIGSPFILLDHQTFLKDWSDIQAYGGGNWAPNSAHMGFGIISRYAEILGPVPLGYLLLGAGLIGLFFMSPQTALFVSGALIWCGLALFRQNRMSVVINYLFCVSPFVALLSAGTWATIRRGTASKWVKTIIAASLFFFPLRECIRIGTLFLAPDTRLEAKAWIEANIPTGSRLLVDQVHTEPPLVMAKSQALRLYERAEANHHPRGRYFRLLLDSHPGGGYELFRISRTDMELISMIRHRQWSQQGYEDLEVEKGLSEVKQAKIDYVIWSSAGATPMNAPRLMKYFDELKREGILIKEFTPTRVSYAPTIRIYKIPS